MQYIISILFIFANTQFAVAQLSYLDSLKSLVNGNKSEDSTMVNHEVKISVNYLTIPDSCIYYANKALQLSMKLKYDFGEADANNLLQHAYLSLGNYDQSMYHAMQAMHKYQEAGDSHLTAEILSSIGDIYNEMGDYRAALNYYFQFRKIIESASDSYFTETNRQSFISKKDAILASDNKIASTYLKGNMPDSALLFAKQGYTIATQIKSRYSVFSVLGDIYIKLNQVDSALKYYRLCNEEIEKNLGFAVVYRNKNSKDSCAYYAKKAFDNAQLLGLKKSIMKACELMGWAYEKTDLPQAMHYYQISSMLKDSLYSQEKTGRVNGLVFNDELRKKELKETEAKFRSKLVMYGLSATLFVFLLIALLLWRNIVHKQKAYALLQEQKKETELQKTHVESAFGQLKAAQSKLIQSEKMASLGELTAGIAHEIQNPLNFVNNFSEVNNELIDELQTELKAGNATEAFALSNDIKANEQKINHHGKRADAIVKGMLQHSRSSTGQKEPTDINALADEYLRLAYHGLRAKDKSFNATINTDFDEALGNINIVPQDIGRVLLNLYNNAFFSVNEKKKQQPVGYEASVSVSTKRIDDKVEIMVRDNGNGIPQKVVDKIFQPFFTTKPTGQGTGLGLSLSYDIIKAHGGEIKVETKAGEGSIFVICLPEKLLQ